MAKRQLGLFGLKKSNVLQFSPFHRHAEDLPSETDSSDSDYAPQDSDKEDKNRDKGNYYFRTKHFHISQVQYPCTFSDFDEYQVMLNTIIRSAKTDRSGSPNFNRLVSSIVYV